MGISILQTIYGEVSSSPEFCGKNGSQELLAAEEAVANWYKERLGEAEQMDLDALLGEAYSSYHYEGFCLGVMVYAKLMRELAGPLAECCERKRVW
jgi:hypothetical protein